jgi:dipeptidyl aminopeptidase/acylaminoacyl peptidase
VLYPVTDLAELDATTHRFERFYNRVLVGPVEQYADRSPLHHAHALRRPLLVLHGDADPVVSVGQSRAFAAAARAAGADVEIAIYEGEGHGWKKPETTVNELERTSAFLALHCPSAS